MKFNRVWVFDLDNTLHNASPHIFPHINRAMTAYLQTHLGLDESGAGELRQQYWRRYGATLIGLMRNHATDPRDFLRATHEFPALAKMVVREPADCMTQRAEGVVAVAHPFGDAGREVFGEDVEGLAGPA